MAIQKLTRLYEGQSLSGANDAVLFVPIEFDCTIQKIKVKLEETSTADVVFALVNSNGTTIAGTGLTIASGADFDVISGLTITRLEDADIFLKMISGAVNSTLTLTLTVDDGEATGGGVTSHSDLTDLDADDHAQYFNQTRGDARYAQSSSVTTALASKADLVSGKVPSAQLPSFVDDVLEYANLAAFPAPGETGKIYISEDTNWEYRWSGSAYVRIVASPGTTDEVPESGAPTNKYFTNARVLATTLFGYVIDASNTAIAATDTILQAFQKIQGQINTIFGTLNNKINSSYLDTDTTLAANSDAKIATQKAVKAYVAANAGSSSSLPTQSGNAGKFLTTDGSSASWATPGASVDWKAVTWVKVTGALTYGAQLKKNAGTSAFDAGASSYDKITGSGKIRFYKNNLTNTSQFIGLSATDTNANFNTINYAVTINDSGYAVVYENGVSKTPANANLFNAGDYIEIIRTGTQITYAKNGAVFYTSLTASSGNLIADTTLYYNNSTIDLLEIYQG